VPLDLRVGLLRHSVRSFNPDRLRPLRGVEKFVAVRAPVWPVIGELGYDAIGEPLTLQPVHVRAVAQRTRLRLTELDKPHGLLLPRLPRGWLASKTFKVLVLEGMIEFVSLVIRGVVSVPMIVVDV